LKAKTFKVCIALLLSAVLTEASAAEQPTEASSEETLQQLAELSIEELINVRVTSIATGTQKPLSEAAAIASVITSQDIEAMGATTVEEALESVPGVHISHSGEVYSPKYLIRGISTKYNPETLVLINGIPITSSFRGDRTAFLGTLPVKMVSKIEVIRGPGSALYGADAFAGVVNVVTKSPSEIDGTEVGVGAGSFRSHEAWLFHSEVAGDLKGTLMVNYRDTEGHKREITADAQTRLDNLTGTNASLAPGPPSLLQNEVAVVMDIEKLKWRLRGSIHERSNLGSGQGVSEALDPNSRFTYARQTLDLTYHDPKLGEHWDFTTQLACYHGSQEIDQNLNLFPPGANLGNGVFPDGVIGNPEFWERHIRFDNSAFYTGFENHRIRLGVGYQFLHLYQVQTSRNFDPSNFAPRPGLTDATDTSEIYIPEKSRTGVYAFAQDEWRLGHDWEFTAGLRYDRYSDFGGTLNPRAALVWKTTPALTTKLLYGRAFRAPSFVELYTINNPVTLGNPDLRPEINNVYELAWSYQATPDWSAGLNLFHYNVSDLIAIVKDPVGTTATAQNFGSQTGNGFEFETKFKATSQLFLTGNYSYLKATNENADKPSGNYPSQQAYFRDDWTFLPKWTWGNQINWIGPQDREPGDPRGRLKGYTTVDVILRYKMLPDKLSLTASVRNFFDADVREPSSGPGPTTLTPAIPNDLPQAGRNGFIELAYRF